MATPSASTLDAQSARAGMAVSFCGWCFSFCWSLRSFHPGSTSAATAPEWWTRSAARWGVTSPPPESPCGCFLVRGWCSPALSWPTIPRMAPNRCCAPKRLLPTSGFRSLWRGRLEIGTLELDNPSLNLVRGPDGHWNVEELIQRTSQVSSAPTTAKRPEVRPRFPYIEATGGRINFKLGQVKKAFSFTEADFALWRESETEWGLRLLAKPMRTDVEISDTGMLRVEGRFQSANQLRNTPMVLKAEFSKGQLGQITKLIYGRDRGWRGGTSASANLTGTPAALSVVLDAAVDDFRRYDIALGQPLRMQAHCTGMFSTDDDSINDMSVRVAGQARHLAHHRQRKKLGLGFLQHRAHRAADSDGSHRGASPVT